MRVLGCLGVGGQFAGRAVGAARAQVVVTRATTMHITSRTMPRWWCPAYLHDSNTPLACLVAGWDGLEIEGLGPSHAPKGMETSWALLLCLPHHLSLERPDSLSLSVTSFFLLASLFCTSRSTVDVVLVVGPWTMRAYVRSIGVGPSVDMHARDDLMLKAKKLLWLQRWCCRCWYNILSFGAQFHH